MAPRGATTSKNHSPLTIHHSPGVPMTVTIHFHGASGTVTGSCYRIVHPKGQFLVDCGMFQGNKTVRDLNYKPLPFDPKAIDFLLLTHAHIDHAGLLPKLT